MRSPDLARLVELIQATARGCRTDRLSFQEFRRHTGLGMSHIYRHFNDWSEACLAAGIASRAGQPPRPHSFSRDECIAELRRVASLLRVHELTQQVYERSARISVSVVCRRLGRWTQALTAAGLVPTRAARLEEGVTQQDVLDDLKRVGAAVGGAHLSRAEYKRMGKYSTNTVSKKLGGSWQAACREAGLLSGPLKTAFTVEQLAAEFLDVVERRGRIPALKRLAGLTGHADATFGRKFGGYSRFKLLAIDHIFASGRSLPSGMRDLLEREHARCVAAVQPRRPKERSDRRGPHPAASASPGLNTLINRLRSDDEHLNIEAKEAFFANTRHANAAPGRPQANQDTDLADMLKTVVAFANTIGGHFIIGLKDKTWEPVGIDDTDLLLCKNWEGFKRRFTRLVSDKVGGIAPAPEVRRDESTGRTVAIIEVSQLPTTCFENRDLAYLKNNNQPFVRANGDSNVLAPADRARHCDAMLARRERRSEG